MAQRLGHSPTIVHGRRVTNDLDLQIVQWTIRGYLNTQLVSQAHANAIPAVGLSGADASMIRVTKRPPWSIEGERVDFGWVGDIHSVDTELLTGLLDKNFTPIVAPLGIDAKGQLYNVNADTVAATLASALRAGQFILVTEAGGVRQHPDDPASLLPQFDRDLYNTGIEEGWIRDGMRVKLKVGFDVFEAGVPEVFIVAPDDVLERRSGTQIVASVTRT